MARVYDWEDDESYHNRDWDEEMEYKEQCITELLNAVENCRQFLGFKEMLKVILDHE